MAIAKLLLVDKREIFREGLAKLLRDKLKAKRIETCACGRAAIEKAGTLQPDVVLIDTQLDGNECTETVRSISKLLPSARILVITHSESERELQSSISAGAMGYVCKDVSLDELMKALTLVAQGNVIITSPMASKMLAELGSLETSEGKTLANHETRLSQREQEILRLVAKGSSNKEVANALFISENTVKVHLRNIMEKLHVHSRLQAALAAQQKKPTASEK